MTRRTIAIVQARTSSSRLPGKVLMDIAGRPSILFMTDRLRRACSLAGIVVATSDDPSDDGLAELLAANDVPCYRGDLHDVLTRFCGAASFADADLIVRLTGDCPIIDPDLVDSVVDLINAEIDYASNVEPPSFPDGLDVEVFTHELLFLANGQAILPSEREHVTPWMRRDAHRNRRANLVSPVDMSSLRWTVDYIEDWERIRAMVERLACSPLVADRFDFLRVVSANPHLVTTAHPRNEGYALSLAAENDRKPGA